MHAVLVPEGAFRAAGAGVTTILTFRRHDVGVAEALDTLDEDQTLKVLAEYDQGWDQGGFVEGQRLVTTTRKGDDVQYELRGASSTAARLGVGKALGVGRFGQTTYPGDVDERPEVLSAIHDAAVDGLKGAGVTLPNVLEQIRVHFGDAAWQRAVRTARGS